MVRRKKQRSRQPDDSDPDSERKAIARRAVLEVVENQLRDNDPPETQRTLDRLMAMGHSRDEAIGFIGAVVAVEIFEIGANQGTFDMPRYVANLQALPELPD